MTRFLHNTVRAAFALGMLGCGDGLVPVDASVPTDASSSDGALPTGFDPSMTYPGEGNACDFSIFCGEFQICVDGECARHERFGEDDLEYGDPVEMTLDRAMESPLYTASDFEWADAEGRVLSGHLSTAMVPGPKGPVNIVWSSSRASLVADSHVFVYGDGAPRGFSVPDLFCTAATVVGDDGLLIVAGLRAGAANEHGIRAIDKDGVVLYDVSLPPAFVAAVADASGPEEYGVAGISSLLPTEGGVLFSVAMGHPPAPDEEYIAPQSTAYGFLGPDGAIRVHETPLGVATRGSYGWLVADGVSELSILTTYSERSGGPTTVEVANLDSGERHVVFDAAPDVASLVRFFQPTSTEWWWSVIPGVNGCQFEGRRGLELNLSQTFRGDPCVSWSNGPEHPFITPSSFAPAHLGNPHFPWIWQENLEERPVWVLGGREQTRRLPVLDNYHLGLLPISRFGRTVEIVSATVLGGGVSLYELPLSRKNP